MDIIYATADKVYNNTLIMLGNFDGLHLAHMSVINKGIQYAKENALKSTMFMFENHTRNEKLITPNKIKLKILSDIAPDFLYIEKFDDNIMKKSPEEFIQMLIKKLGMRAVCIGYDYRFGYKAQGDGKSMYSLGKKYGFDVLVTGMVSINNTTVSSTHIRTLIENGDMKKASEFMGRPFTMCGVVERGLQNGRKLGFPTANISVDKDSILPKCGVYAGFSEVNGKKYKSVINVGNNPTFNAKNITVESHIIDFCGDIYNENVTVSFLEYIRGDIKFNGLEELKNQILKDKKKAIEILK